MMDIFRLIALVFLLEKVFVRLMAKAITRGDLLGTVSRNCHW